tara:strand:- start:418 stop:795 length:378 start_codon:yes stop_codon:yes gene_type:complete
MEVVRKSLEPGYWFFALFFYRFFYTTDIEIKILKTIYIKIRKQLLKYMMKNIFNTIWELLGWLIGAAIPAVVGFFGFKLVIEGYNMSALDNGVFWLFFKYPGLILFALISLGMWLLSLVAVWGFF